MDYISEDVDASEAVDRDIEAYKKQLAEEEARDEAMLQDLQERFDNQYVCGDTDHHHWG